MAELGKHQKLLLSESDMAKAAAVASQQLMQLSDEDIKSSEKSSNVNNKKKCLDDDKEEEDYVQSRKEKSWAKKIEEIFGKEEDESYRPKKRRYRTLVSLYGATKPIPLDRFRKKMRY